MEQEKIFIKHIPGKKLIYRIERDFLKLDNKKQANLKMGKGLEQTFLQKKVYG